MDDILAKAAELYPEPGPEEDRGEWVPVQARMLEPGKQEIEKETVTIAILPSSVTYNVASGKRKLGDPGDACRVSYITPKDKELAELIASKFLDLYGAVMVVAGPLEGLSL